MCNRSTESSHEALIQRLRALEFISARTQSSAALANVWRGKEKRPQMGAPVVDGVPRSGATDTTTNGTPPGAARTFLSMHALQLTAVAHSHRDDWPIVHPDRLTLDSADNVLARHHMSEHDVFAARIVCVGASPSFGVVFSRPIRNAAPNPYSSTH